MELQFEIAGHQIDGAREYQEDAFIVTHLGDANDPEAGALVVMADGMGGHAAGNVASNLATSTFHKAFSGAYRSQEIPDALRTGLLAANGAIASAIHETPGLQGMGCTMVAVFVQGARLWWVSVGDSHLYLLRDRQLLKQNADHSYGGYLRRMREQGVEVSPDPSLSPHMLMSAMIGEEIAEIDLPREPFELHPGDRLVIASDGLDTLGQGAIIQYAAWSKNAKEYVSALLEAVANANQPRQDNTTVVVIDARARAEAAAGRAVPAGVEPPVLEEVIESTTAFQVPAPAPAAAATGAGAGAKESSESIEAPWDEFEEALPEPAFRRAAEPEPEPASRKGLWIGLAVFLVALAAGGAYYALELRGPAEVARGPDEPVERRDTGITAVPDEAAELPALPDEDAVALEPGPEPALPGELPAAGEMAPGTSFRDVLAGGGKGPEMVWLPGGRFEMGGKPTSLNPDERPRRAVQIAPLAVSKFEVTYSDYDRFAQATNRRVPPSGEVNRDTHPVTQVSWDDAYAYTRWLSQQTGQRYRLPSEAEWEYAARAGTDTEYWWGNLVGAENAHCFDCKSGLHPRQTARAGYFKPNPFGLYDTAGNVFEWVHDCYHPNYQGAPTDGSVWEGGDCTRRVARGGSFSSASSALRSAKRDRFVPTQGYDNVGIRLVREP